MLGKCEQNGRANGWPTTPRPIRKTLEGQPSLTYAFGHFGGIENNRYLLVPFRKYPVPALGGLGAGFSSQCRN
jgi:hypothetical protein